jgi:hypothetical protein
MDLYETLWQIDKVIPDRIFLINRKGRKGSAEYAEDQEK